MLIIFDLDGTLIDSSKDLAISTNATRAQFGLGPLEQQVINSYVGNGAATLVRRAMGPEVSERTAAEALAFFLKYYRAHALEHTKLYDGVREVVQDLAASGNELGVLTNKPCKISFDILGALGIQRCFKSVCGGDTFPNKKPDPIGILRIAEEVSAPLAETLMVGDSSVDIQTARNAGVPSCGVTWGLQPETLEIVQPDFVINQPNELIEVVSSVRN